MLNWVLVGLTVLVLHAFAVGAYVTMYKFKAEKSTSVAIGTLALGGVYSILLTIVAIVVLFVHP